MPRSSRSLLLGSLVLLICLALLLTTREGGQSASADVLQAEGELQWFKGNIHTHSHWSDGDDYLENIGLWYREHDYQFLCFTDHNVLANTERWVEVAKTKGGQVAYDKLKKQFPGDWVEERMTDGKLEVRLKRFNEVKEKLAQPGKYLLIQGEEISDSFDRKPIHLNATNIQSAIPPMKGESIADTIQNNVNAVIAQRERTGEPILVHLNHPNFGYAVRAEDLMGIRGEQFFEVYNGHPSVYNNGNEQHAGTERIWDIINAFRLTQLDLPLMYGLGTDDGHNYHAPVPSNKAQPGRGWVMVLASKLDPVTLIQAMESGRFYASNGVTLKSVGSDNTGLEVEVEPQEGVTYTIEFVGTLKGFDATSQPMLDKDGKEIHTTRIYSKEIGQTLKSVAGPKARYEFQGNELYVRATVISSRPHPNPSEPGDMEKAWVQPTLGPGYTPTPAGK